MNLVYLQDFVVLAEAGSYHEAAERLYMNQSTLSKHIKALETELGVQLFDRSTRQVRITPYGEHLLPFAKKMEALRFQYETELVQRTGMLLTIGTIPTMAEYDIVPLIRRFKEQYPALRVRIAEGDSQELKQGLVSGKYDLAFLRDGDTPFTTHISADDQLDKIPWLQDRAVAVIPSGHALHGQDTIRLPQLKEHRLCLLKEGTMLYDICVRACQAAGFVPNIFFESHRIGNIIEMCMEAGCVALLLDQHLNAPIIHRMMQEDGLAVATIAPLITTTFSLGYRKKEKLSEPGKAFLRFFQEETQKDGRGQKPDRSF